MIKEKEDFMKDPDIQKLFTYAANWSATAKLEIEFLNTIDLIPYLKDDSNEVYEIRSNLEDDYEEAYADFLKSKELDPEEYGGLFNVLDDDDFIHYVLARYDGLGVHEIFHDPEYYFYEKK